MGGSGPAVSCSQSTDDRCMCIQMVSEPADSVSLCTPPSIGGYCCEESGFGGLHHDYSAAAWGRRMTTGAGTGLVGQSLALVDALERHAVRFKALLLAAEDFPDAGCSFINFGGRRASQLALRTSLEFLAEAQASCQATK